jgi:hypothetical protein
MVLLLENVYIIVLNGKSLTIYAFFFILQLLYFRVDVLSEDMANSAGRSDDLKMFKKKVG